MKNFETFFGTMIMVNMGPDTQSDFGLVTGILMPIGSNVVVKRVRIYIVTEIITAMVVLCHWTLSQWFVTIGDVDNRPSQ